MPKNWLGLHGSAFCPYPPEIRRDFTLVHPEYFVNEKYVIEKGAVKLNNDENAQEYKALIIIGCNIIFYKTLAQDTTRIQKNSNENGGLSIFIPDPDRTSLAEALKSKLTSDVEFMPNSRLSTDFGKFSYLHKIKHGRDIYYFANSSDKKVETEVLPRGKLSLEKWNSHNGKIAKEIETEYVERDNQQFTRISINLNPVKSVFFISK